MTMRSILKSLCFGFHSKKSVSSQVALSPPDKRPKHVAIIMDGNGRWAESQGLMRIMGHKQGVASAMTVIDACCAHQIQALTLFAFSTENWKRPKREVGFIMQLFSWAASLYLKKLHQKNVRIKHIGDISGLSPKMQQLITRAETLTQNNTGLCLLMAVNYGGRWDIVQAARALAQEAAAQTLNPEKITQALFEERLSTAGVPEVDLLIRTGNEVRVSNFLLWQTAYSEYYFTDVLWPAFTRAELEKAFAYFGRCQRRFGDI